MNTLTTTILILGCILPFALRDGKQNRVILLSILLLLPFYQGFVYFRHMTFLFLALMIWQGNDRQLLQYGREPINRCMKLFFALSLISALLSTDITRAVVPVTDLVFFYLLFLICSVAVQRQLTTTLVPRIIMWCLLSSIFIQTMQLYDIKAFYIYAEDSLNMNTGLSYEGSDRVVRYWGPFGNSLTFSSYLAVFGLFLFGYYHSSLQKKHRRLSYWLLIIAIYGVLLTAGRTAFISLAIGLLMYAFIKNWKKAIPTLLCLVVVLLLFSAGIDQLLSGSSAGIYQRFTTFSNDNNYRTETWVRALPVLLASPVFGTGPGNLQTEIAPLIRSFFINEGAAIDLPWAHVENTYLSVLYTFGASGFACFLYMITKSFLYSVGAMKKYTTPAVRQLGYGLTTAWIGMAINMIANPVFVTDYRLIVLMLFFVAYAVQVGWVPGRRGIKAEQAPFQQAPAVPHLTQLA